MQFVQTHEALVAAHRIARRHNSERTPYQQRFTDALRAVYSGIRGGHEASIATRALARADHARTDRSANIEVTSILRNGERVIGRVRNNDIGTTYQTVLFLGGDRGGFYCTCPDHEWRGGVCKHGVALAEALVREHV